MTSSKRPTAVRMVERPGLRNVITGPTRLCRMDPRHRTLEYCGYSVAELATRSCFEEVAYLLLHNELPDEAQLAELRAALADTPLEDMMFGVPQYVYMTFRAHAWRSHPMHMLRGLVSVFGANDVIFHPSDTPQRRAVRLLGIMPVLLRYLALSSCDIATLRDAVVVTIDPRMAAAPYSLAKVFLHLLKGKEPVLREAALLDASLILYAEHEVNIGTHALHAIASANADLYSAVCGAMGALSGDLHGGANEAALELLQEIGSTDRVEAVLRQKLQTGESVKGFGHAVYKSGDPRCAILKPMVKAFAKEKGREDFYHLAEIVEKTMLGIKKGKKLYPNIDFWIAVLYELLDIPKTLFTPLFAMGRMAGWCAHYLEYRELNRSGGRLNLMRPRARYVGYAPRPYVPIGERGFL